MQKNNCGHLTIPIVHYAEQFCLSNPVDLLQTDLPVLRRISVVYH